MKSLVLLCLLCVTLGYTAHVRKTIPDHRWQSWKIEHQKGYRDVYEEETRYAIWRDNLDYVMEFNAKNKETKLGMNHFADLTNTEYRIMMNGYKMRNKTRGATFLPPANLKAPDAVDWRKEGYVTPVKDQGQCGSCWAFSTTGSLEGQHFKATGDLVSLSEQNLVDCSGKYGNEGCNGGLMDSAFEYIIDHGIDTEKSYPYKAQDGTCKFSSKNIGATMTNFIDVKSGDENALKEAVAANGPVSVAIDASHRSFQLYSTGVYNEKQCSSKRLDHGVLAVGYGSSNGVDYWLVKNSWGTSWGQQGYIWMKRNANNQCGIATEASYPQV